MFVNLDNVDIIGNWMWRQKCARNPLSAEPKITPDSGRLGKVKISGMWLKSDQVSQERWEN